MTKAPAIHIAISTDERGFTINATLVASILRRTERNVWVRCWCRGFLPESFETGRLRMEFRPAVGEVTGEFPEYVGRAVFDRLRVIGECDDWDRCLVRDYDQLALRDIVPLYDMDTGGALLAAKMHGAGMDMAYVMSTFVKKPFPQGWEHAASYPYFTMGPLLNLKATREAGTWKKLVAAQAAFGMDEQLSLTAATEGRTVGFDLMWNLFPKTDFRDDHLPEGVIHWLGWPKPWHEDAEVWRPDVWEAERATWEHLRMGIWDKPLAVKLEPDDPQEVQALVERGWKVVVVTRPGREAKAGEAEDVGLVKFPDLRVMEMDRAAFQEYLAGAPKIDSLRFGQRSKPDEWLEGVAAPPRYLQIKGPRPAAMIDRIRAWGYGREARYFAEHWQRGGPLPRVLDFHPVAQGSGLVDGEVLALVFCRRNA